MTRAYDPWPGTFTSLSGKNLKVLKVALIAGDGTTAAGAGTISIRERRLFVSTGDGELELLTVQPEGKKPITARDLINGTPGLDGSRLGT
jgi:methionyl-tRNA formyltransferase